ncbi:hypothetical protein DL767_002558 [Monosporascus sp. MG133]|nr:hypothetical protein DL767_002558 [Monosporascus sp. MG133]
MTLKEATTGGTHLNFTRFCNVIDGNLVGSGKSRCFVNPSTLEEKPQAVTGFADALGALLEDFARMLTKGNGKPLDPTHHKVLSGDDELGLWLTEYLGVDKVSFSGFTATGKRVLQNCSKTVKRVTLELGGNDPATVCDDLDPLVVAPKIAMAALMKSGQACIAIKRVLIHEAIYQKVLIAMVEFVKTLKVGDGFEENTFIGPITNSAQFDRVKGLLADISDNQLKLAYDGMGLQERPKASSSPRPSWITP